MADFDDSPGKSRKNLVTLAGAIIAGAYLRPQLPGDAKLLGVIEVGHIEGAKFWVVLLVLLVYFFIRFMRSDAWSAPVSNWRSSRQRLWNSKFAEQFDDELRLYLKGGTSKRLVGARMDVGEHTLPSANAIELTARTVNWPEGKQTHGEAQLGFTWVDQGRRRSGKFSFAFEAPKRYRPWAYRALWFRTQLQSNLWLEVHLPCALTLLATAITGWEILHACEAGAFLACIKP